LSRHGSVMEPVRIDLRRLRWVLIIGVGALALAHVVADVVLQISSDLFNLNEESTLGTWASTMLLATAAVGCWVASRVGPSTTRWGWRIAAAALGLMSLDEVAMLHERMGTIVSNHLSTGGPLFFAWVIPGSVIALSMLGGLTLFARRLDRRTAVLLVVGAAVFFFGAVGVEMIGGNEISSGLADSRSFVAVEQSRLNLLTTALEESLELVGEAIMVHTVARYLCLTLAGAGGGAAAVAVPVAVSQPSHRWGGPRPAVPTDPGAIGLGDLQRPAPDDVGWITPSRDER